MEMKFWKWKWNFPCYIWNFHNIFYYTWTDYKWLKIKLLGGNSIKTSLFVLCSSPRALGPTWRSRSLTSSTRLVCLTVWMSTKDRHHASISQICRDEAIRGGGVCHHILVWLVSSTFCLPFQCPSVASTL